ncbi:MAG: D-aminoacyl-tRNA deacylase [Myxococcota bacterium]|jgi:D-aminoacyl-tRNA deacylase|nr:D-aminoacyl-tRNA deacylase [Myxococcota bacterium]
MRAVVQRVSEASVEVAGERVAEMEAGLLVLVAVGQDDSEEDAVKLARKVVGMRIFGDAQGRMNHSLLEMGGSLAVVSQFTLLGDCRKGRRPFFGAAADPERAEPLVERVVDEARRLGCEVVTGRFQAEMRVALVNEGPVTLLLDTRDAF